MHAGSQALATIPMASVAMAPRPARAGSAPRQRLPALVRSGQILDAALQTFCRHGFAATRMDDIAAAAGLSKGGIYTHFRSKEEIFEALLARVLVPPPLRDAALLQGGPVSVDLLANEVIAPIYAVLGDPAVVQTVRLLLADGARMPEHVARWRQATVEPFREMLARLVQRGVRQGSLRPSVPARSSWLLVAPVAHVILDIAIGIGADARSLAACERAHVAMLRELLEFR